MKFDLSKFNPTFFDRLRARVQQLNAVGIYAGVYPFSGEFLLRFRFSGDGYPFTGSNNVNGIDDGGGTRSVTMTAPDAITAIQDAYVKKVIDMCYGIVTTLAGVCFCLMRYYVFYVARLVDETIDHRLLKTARLRSVVNPLLHFVAVLLALADTRLALALYVILPLIFFTPSKLERHDTSAC